MRARWDQRWPSLENVRAVLAFALPIVCVYHNFDGYGVPTSITVEDAVLNLTHLRIAQQVWAGWKVWVQA